MEGDDTGLVREEREGEEEEGSFNWERLKLYFDIKKIISSA